MPCSLATPHGDARPRVVERSLDGRPEDLERPFKPNRARRFERALPLVAAFKTRLPLDELFRLGAPLRGKSKQSAFRLMGVRKLRRLWGSSDMRSRLNGGRAPYLHSRDAAFRLEAQRFVQIANSRMCRKGAANVAKSEMSPVAMTAAEYSAAVATTNASIA